MDRETLLSNIYEGRTGLEDVLNNLSPQQMTQPVLSGGWTVKDLIAHLGFWERRALQVFDALRQGQQPDNLTADMTIDELNASVYQQNRAQALPQVQAEELAAYRALLRAVETADPADLFDASRYAWTQGQPFADWIIGNTYGHYAEHIPDLQRVTLEQTTPHPVIEQAGEFIYQHGREIDRARYDYHFAGSISQEDLLNVLAQYQNEDGGFFGLEVDIKASVSNPFATELALNILRWADTPPNAPILQRAVAYLEDTQQEDGAWRFTPEIYQSDLAPWFQGWQWPNLNPSCPLAGLLKQLGVGSNQLHTRVQRLFEQLAAPSDLAGGEYYNAKPYADYLQTGWQFPQADFYRWGVAWWMLRQVSTNPEMDATHWMSFAPRPQSAVAQLLPTDTLQTQLDRLLSERSEDGGWPSPYSPDWRPWNTVQNLLILRAYQRV